MASGALTVAFGSGVSSVLDGAALLVDAAEAKATRKGSRMILMLILSPDTDISDDPSFGFRMAHHT